MFKCRAKRQSTLAHVRKRTVGHLQRGLDHRIVVRRGDETRFVHARRQVHAAVEHGVEKALENLNIGCGHIGIVARQLGGEIKTEHAAFAVGAESHTVPCGGGVQAAHEFLGRRAQALVKPRLLDQAQLCHAGSHRHRIARQRARLVHRAQRRELVHHVGAAAEGRQRHAAANHLAHHHQIGANAVHLLCAAQRHAKTGHHLVPHQQRAVLGAELAQALMPGRSSPDEIHIARDGFHHHAGDFVSLPGKQFLDLGDVVELQHQRVLGQVGRHPGGAGIAEGQQARTGLD